MTCTTVRVTPNPNPNHVLSGTSAAVTEPAPGIWDLNTKLVLSEHHPISWKVGSLLHSASIQSHKTLRVDPSGVCHYLTNPTIPSCGYVKCEPKQAMLRQVCPCHY
jgi:hypothetical protein